MFQICQTSSDQCLNCYAHVTMSCHCFVLSTADRRLFSVPPFHVFWLWLSGGTCACHVKIIQYCVSAEHCTNCCSSECVDDSNKQELFLSNLKLVCLMWYLHVKFLLNLQNEQLPIVIVLSIFRVLLAILKSFYKKIVRSHYITVVSLKLLKYC